VTCTRLLVTDLAFFLAEARVRRAKDAEPLVCKEIKRFINSCLSYSSVHRHTPPYLQDHLECRIAIISLTLPLRILAARLVAIDLCNPRHICRDTVFSQFSTSLRNTGERILTAPMPHITAPA
jgi:hypothetical protein